MRNVEFISAGAGSGKTFTIVNKIVDFIRSGVCRADQIILTTFTRAAATELLEKTRAALYKVGMFDEAMNLESAAIGTIHSISYEIVSRYWYILGLSPDLRLIAEESRDFYVRQSLATLPDDNQLRLFRKVRKKFDIRIKGKYRNNTREPDFYFWKNDLENLIDAINNFCLTNEDLDASVEASVKWLKDIMGVKETDHFIPSPEQLLEMTNKILKGADNITDKRLIDSIPDHKKTISGIIQEYKSKLENKGWETADYIDYGLVLSKIISKKTYEKMFPEEVAVLMELPDRVLALNSSFELTKDYLITLVDLAKKWNKEYRHFKKERRLLDFNDIQGYFTELLKKEQVVDEIRSRYKVALVDEFQDCSPQQVDFFKRLSCQMEKNVWVGDIKQAIYNFRGTDIEVVQEVLDTVTAKQNGNSLSSLDKCWRSNSAIVNLANSIFTKTFKGKLDERLVILGMPEKDAKYNKPEERELKHWHFEFFGAEQRHRALASYLKKVVGSDELPVSYDEIAILCRKGDEIDKYAEAFNAYGIPFRIKKTNDKSSLESNPIILFLNVLISYAANDYNTFSKGMIAYLTEPGYNVSEILSSRLKNILNKTEDNSSEDWLKNIKLLERIDSVRNTLHNQSVAMAVDTLINQLNISDILKRIDSNIDPVKICNDLVGKAKEYDDICSNLSLGSSFGGFVEYIKTHPVNLSGNSNGVLLTTYHGSKGLEWKCVILSDLNNTVIELTKIISGINSYRIPEGVRFNFMPEFVSSRITKPIRTRIEMSEIYGKLSEITLEEAKRLLYVGMTRPKEVLITVTGTSKSISEKGRNGSYHYATKWPDLVTGLPMNAIGNVDEYLDWEGNKFRYTKIQFEPDTEETEKKTWFSEMLIGSDSIREYPDRNLLPSKMPISGNFSNIELAGDFADRLLVKASKGENATIGDCIHQLLCVYQNSAEFKSLVPDILSGYGVTLATDSFMNSALGMYEWLKKNYGEPVSILREIPFSYNTPEGQRINGEIDLIYRTKNGDILVDYKTYSGKVSDVIANEGKFSAIKYSGQIEIYRKAIEKAGFKVCDSLICYFNLGKMIRLI